MKEPKILQTNATIPVSVIIPVYQTSFFDFRLCLDSIASQTRKPECVIIVDDGNVNCTYDKIVDMFKETIDEQIRVNYIQLPENLGISGARNAGLSRVITPWVSFIDADDCIKETYFERLYKEVEENENVDIVACACDAYDGHEYRRNHFFIGDRTFQGDLLVELEKVLIDGNHGRAGTSIDTAIGVPWGKLYRFSCIPVSFDPLLKRMEDVIWNHKIICSNPNIVIKYIDEPLYIYRTNHINEYNRQYESDVSTWFYALEQRKILVQKHLEADDEVAELYYDEVSRLLAFTVKKKYFHRDNPNRRQDYGELRMYLEDESIREALRRTCGNKPFYCNLTNRLLMHGYIKLAFIVNRLRGR